MEEQEATPVLYDSHMHTPFCKHAKGDPEEYAVVAVSRGLKGITFTCHNPGPAGWSPRIRMAIEEYELYLETIARTREAWNGRLDIHVGLECDYMPGMEPWLEKLLNRAPLSHVLGAVHPQLKYYRDAFYNGNVTNFQQTYYEHLAQAAETGLFDTLAHPDLVKNVFPNHWHVSRLLDIIRPALDRIAATGVAMELNTSGLHKRVREMNPGLQILTEMKERDIPVVIGSDAHEPHRVAADFEMAMGFLAEAGYETVSIVVERQRREIPLTVARESLKPWGST
ncbi:MAG: histidinol-phosphatase HisJ family protein [Chloroflexi bacterium]|nr:MAG: histidinol-phosphatase HisJ family protein [Chloroflexota bacterium]